MEKGGEGGNDSDFSFCWGSGSWVAWMAWDLNFLFQSAELEQKEEFLECFHFLIEHLFPRWYTWYIIEKKARMWFSDCLPSSFYKGGSDAYGYNGSFNAFIGYIHSIDVLREQKEIASATVQGQDAISIHLKYWGQNQSESHLIAFLSRL